MDRIREWAGACRAWLSGMSPDVVAILVIVVLVLGFATFCVSQVANGSRGGLGQQCNRDATCDFPNLACDGSSCQMVARP